MLSFPAISWDLLDVCNLIGVQGVPDSGEGMWIYIELIVNHPVLLILGVYECRQLPDSVCTVGRTYDPVKSLDFSGISKS